MVISCGVRTFGSAVEGMVCLLVGFVLFLCLTNWVRFELDGKGKYISIDLFTPRSKKHQR